MNKNIKSQDKMITKNIKNNKTTLRNLDGKFARSKNNGKIECKTEKSNT